MTPDQLLLAGGASLGLALYLRRNQFKELSEPNPPPTGKRGPITNLLYPMREPLRIGDSVIDFYEKHMALRAMSGGFKTTLMAQILRERLEAGRSCVVVTGGDSDQLETEIRAHGGWIIRPHESPLTFNAFEGTASFMAQGWAGLFPTNTEAKVYHSAFEIAAIRYFETHSRYTVRGLMEFMLTYDPDKDIKNAVVLESGERTPLLSGKLWKGMKEGYVGIRLKLMDMAFGDWIGDQLSVLDCVRRGIPIMFVLDSSNDPDLNRFACALVWQAINYAIREHGSVDAFVDELGRLPIDLVSDQVRTWRRNKSHLIVGSHKDSDFNEILDDLIHVQLLGVMVAAAEKTRTGASKKTWGTVHPTQFGAHAMQPKYTRLHSLLRLPHKGAFWMVDLERVQRIEVTEYHPPKYRKPRWSMHHLNATPKHVTPPTGTGATLKTDASTAYTELPSVDGGTYNDAYVPPSTFVDRDVLEPTPIWALHDAGLISMLKECRRTHIPCALWSPTRGIWIDDRGCLEWQGSYQKPKNGAPWRPRKKDKTPYREFVKASGQNPDPTCDHWCDNPACCEVEHIEGGVQFAENTRRNPLRRYAFENAGWRTVEVPHFDSCMNTCEFIHVRWRNQTESNADEDIQRNQSGVSA
jgi:hypothetical protein